MTDRIVIKAIEEDGRRRPVDLRADHAAVDEFGYPVPEKRRRFRWPKGSLMARWNARKARKVEAAERDRLNHEYEADLLAHGFVVKSLVIEAGVGVVDEYGIPSVIGPIPGDLLVPVGDAGSYADAEVKA